MILDCYTHLEQIRSTFPIQTASKFYPEWWKNLPATFQRDQEGYCPHSRAIVYLTCSFYHFCLGHSAASNHHLAGITQWQSAHVFIAVKCSHSIHIALRASFFSLVVRKFRGISYNFKSSNHIMVQLLPSQMDRCCRPAPMPDKYQ